jgi:glycine cleavage system H protein
MTKWMGVRVKQELLEEVKQEVEKSGYKGLSEFVSEAIQQRLQELTKQRVGEYLERDKAVSVPQLQGQLLRTSDNVWARMAPEGVVEMGVTEYFQKQIKDIVNVRIDMIGAEVAEGEPFGVAESWWFTYDLYAPVKGKVVAVNKDVLENPFVLNADTSQWIVKIQPA